ncbi:MAG: glycoside hydrolase family 16 protein [Bacillota bacterium]
MRKYLLNAYIFPVAFFLFVLIIGSCSGCFGGLSFEEEALIDNKDHQVISGTDAVITDIFISGSDYYPGDTVTARLNILNKGSQKESFWLGCSISDPLGSWYDLPAKEISLEGSETNSVEFSWLVPAEDLDEQLISGPYLLTMEAWSDYPGDEGAERLAAVKQEEAFFVFRYLEDFSSYNKELWEKSSHSLGLGMLDPDNVKIEDELLKIILPAGTYDCGQLESREFTHLYGSYRARIKMPDAPSSITGFFLYRAPDFDHEIDIEVVNDSSGQTWFTTYADGEISNTCETYLGFDPTAGFHEYRFDFYPGSVSFFADGELIITFEDGLTDTPMKLMINSWFPVWLEGVKPQNDAVTLVDWIKY